MILLTHTPYTVFQVLEFSGFEPNFKRIVNSGVVNFDRQVLSPNPASLGQMNTFDEFRLDIGLVGQIEMSPFFRAR